MRSRYFFLFLLLFLIRNNIFAQLEKTLHQAFDLEGKNSVSLDIFGEYKIEPWAGNKILVETNILLYNSTSAVLKHFVEKDFRYSIDADTSSNGELHLESHDKKRITLRTKSGAESTEVVTVKVFVPEDFIVQDQKLLIRETKQN